jgi:hypothetical protein
MIVWNAMDIIGLCIAGVILLALGIFGLINWLIKKIKK